MERSPRCSRHPGAAAGWSCRGCGAELCPGCAFRTDSASSLVCCTRCGGVADLLTIHRAERRPYAARLPAALVAPFRPAALLTLAATAAVMWVLGFLGLPGAILARGIYWGLVFAVVRQTSRGADAVETPDFGDVWDDLGRPALLGLLATALLWVPALLRVIQLVGRGETAFFADPILWGIVVLSVLYVPIAVVHAAVGGSVAGMLNPVSLGGSAVRLGTDYLVAVGAVVVLVAAGAGVAVLAAATLGDLPVISGVVRGWLALFAPVLAARALGLLLYVRGDAVGLGDEADYQEPLLPGATPRGAAPAAPPPPEPPAPIALEVPEASPAAAPPAAPAPAAPAMQGRFDRLELEPAAPAAATDERLVADDVRRGDLRSAAARYAALPAPATTLPARVLFEVARGAAQAGDHPLAVRALKAAARTLDPAVAPDAMLVLGRIYLTRLARPDDARKVLEQLLSRFPGTAAAAQARTLLPPTPRA